MNCFAYLNLVQGMFTGVLFLICKCTYMLGVLIAHKGFDNPDLGLWKLSSKAIFK